MQTLLRGERGLLARKPGFKRVGVFLLQIEQVGERGVDALALPIHPLDVLDVHLDDLQLLPRSLPQLPRLVRLAPQLLGNVVHDLGQHVHLVLQYHLDDAQLVADVFDLGEELGFATNLQQRVDEDGIAVVACFVLADAAAGLPAATSATVVL